MNNKDFKIIYLFYLVTPLLPFSFKQKSLYIVYKESWQKCNFRDSFYNWDWHDLYPPIASINDWWQMLALHQVTSQWGTANVWENNVSTANSTIIIRLTDNNDRACLQNVFQTLAAQIETQEFYLKQCICQWIPVSIKHFHVLIMKKYYVTNCNEWYK